MQKGRGHKYGAVRTVVGGISFPSKAEARRYGELLLLVEAGEISDLELQPSFQMKMKGKNICKYIADFLYIEKGKQVVEDVKGVKTSIYRLKLKMFKASYPQYDFREIMMGK